MSNDRLLRFLLACVCVRPSFMNYSRKLAAEYRVAIVHSKHELDLQPMILVATRLAQYKLNSVDNFTSVTHTSKSL